jgi:hypothetical protein
MDDAEKQHSIGLVNIHGLNRLPITPIMNLHFTIFVIFERWGWIFFVAVQKSCPCVAGNPIFLIPKIQNRKE